MILRLFVLLRRSIAGYVTNEQHENRLKYKAE